MQYQLLKSSKLNFIDCCETKGNPTPALQPNIGQVGSFPCQKESISLVLCCSAKSPMSWGTQRGWGGVEWHSPCQYRWGSHRRLCCCFPASRVAPAGSCPLSPCCPHLPAPQSTVFQLKNPSEKSASKKRSFFSSGLVLWPCPSHQLHKH